MHNAIVDADSMVYAAGWIAAKKSGPVSHATHAFDMIMRDILKRLDTYDYEVYLTGSSGSDSRKAILPDYKLNRAAMEKPPHFDDILDHVVCTWSGMFMHDMEADDVVAIRARQEPRHNVIVAIDKDLWTVPGWHYNWRKKELEMVEEFDAAYAFYTQVLIGDTADNVPGLHRVGVKTAAKILDGCSTEAELYEATAIEYKSRGHSLDDFIHTCRVLWIIREVDEHLDPVIYQPPSGAKIWRLL